jgi:acyl-ACP thioesterase
MYEYESRVRLSEVDQNRRMTMQAILNYFQDCSTFHSEDLGVGVEYLEEKKRMWVLASWKIVVNRYPLLGERIRVGTWPYEFERMTGRRNFRILDSKGEMAAYADSRWVYMNTERMRPMQVEPEVSGAYEIEPPLLMEEESKAIILPETMEGKDSFPVQEGHLDVNHHVNNGQYVRMAAAYLPDDFQIHQMRADYKKSAVWNNIIYPKVGIGEDRCTVLLGDEAGKPYAVIEFK